MFGERAIYIVDGQISVSDKVFPQKNLMVFKNSTEIKITFEKDTHCLLFGGEPFKNRRFIWWNFVSSSRDKIELAKMKWKQMDFPLIPGETEFVPLPNY